MNLPPKWTSEALPEAKDAVLIRSASGFMVTVDYYNRCFRAGLSYHGTPASRATYKGRGWRDALTANAIAWLDSVST